MAFIKYEIINLRGSLEVCELCRKKFGPFLREHQCKRCLRGVCSDCADHKADVYKQGNQVKPHRLCNSCKKDSDFIRAYVAQQKLAFGKMSEIGSKWTRKITKQPSTSEHPGRSKSRLVNAQAFKKMWDSYNYSLREFIGLLTFSLRPGEFEESVKATVDLVLLKFSNEEIQTVAYLAAFILCFCTPNAASRIICHLILLRNRIKEPLDLLELYLSTLDWTQGEMTSSQDYLRMKLRKAVSTLSINELTVQVNFHFINRILQTRHIEELVSSLAVCLDLNKDKVLTNKQNFGECDLFLLRESQMSEIIVRHKIVSALKVNDFLVQDLDSQSMANINAAIIQMMSGKGKVGSQQDASTKGPSISSNYEDQQDSSPIHQRQAILHNGSHDHHNGSEREPIKGSRSDKVATNLNSQRNKQDSHDKESRKVSERWVERSAYEQVRNNGPCQQCKNKDFLISALEAELNEANETKRRLKSLSFSSDRPAMDFQNDHEEETEFAAKQEAFKNEKAKLDKKIQQMTQANKSLHRQIQQLRKDVQKNSRMASEFQTSYQELKRKNQEDQINGNFATASQAAGMIEMLKEALHDKNSQIESLTKRYKLVEFQMEEAMNQPKAAKRTDEELENQRKEVKDLMHKIGELTDHIMRCEENNLQVNEEVFFLKEVLRAHKIEIPSNE